MKNILLLCLISITLSTTAYAKENTTKKDNTLMTREEVKQTSQTIENSILSKKTLDFDAINNHESLLLGYGLDNENVMFMQKVVHRSIDLYGLDSLETKITYLYLSLAYFTVNDKASAQNIYSFVEDTKENKKYEDNIVLNHLLAIGKAKFKSFSGEYKEARDIMLKHLKELEKDKQVDGKVYVKNLMFMASLENTLGDYKKAQEYMIQRNKILIKNKIILSLDEKVNAQILISDINVNRKKYQESISATNMIINFIQESNETLRPKRNMELLSKSCINALMLGEFNLAKSIGLKALNMQKKLKLKDNVYIIDVFLCLGIAEKERNQYKTSIQLYKEALFRYSKMNKHYLHLKEIKEEIKKLETLIKQKKGEANASK